MHLLTEPQRELKSPASREDQPGFIVPEYAKPEHKKMKPILLRSLRCAFLQF